MRFVNQIGVFFHEIEQNIPRLGRSIFKEEMDGSDLPYLMSTTFPELHRFTRCQTEREEMNSDIMRHCSKAMSVIHLKRS